MKAAAMYHIGFANQDERNPFALSVCKYFKSQIDLLPDVSLIVRDNIGDSDVARANSRHFADYPVDVAIIFHIDERAGLHISYPLRMKGIPIISIDIPIPLSIFVGIDGYRAGQEAGRVLATAIQDDWGGEVDKILIVTDHRMPGIVQKRFDGALDSLSESIDIDHVLRLDGASDATITSERVMTLLETGWKDIERMAVICLNDHTAMGVLSAARYLNREQHMMIASYDGTAIAIEEFQKPESRLLVSPIFPVAEYSKLLLDLSLRLIKKERVSRKNLIAPVCLTRDNYQDFLEY